MAVPDKDALIGPTVTEAQFKNNLGAIVDFIKLIESQSPNYATTALLTATRPVENQSYAKALDTGKVWYWNKPLGSPDGNYWVETELSELDQANEYTDAKTAESIDFTKDRLKFLKKLYSDSALFSFADSDQDSVILFLKDGDIVTPFMSLKEFKQAFDLLKKQSDSSFKKNYFVSNTLFVFEDSELRQVVAITDDADILFDKDKSLKLELKKLNVRNGFSEKLVKQVTAKEQMTDEFFNLYMQSKLLGNTSNLSAHIGAYKQKFTIKNVNDFLSLRISQPAEYIKIATPYSTYGTTGPNEVVHPYICSYHKTVRGYKNIVVLTPFHNTNDQYENPCVYGTDDFIKFDLLDGFHQPLAEPLPIVDVNYNSDPCVVYDHQSGEFCVLYRWTVMESDRETIKDWAYYIRRTKDFYSWTDAVKVRLSVDGLSPSIVFNTALNKWMLFSREGSLKYRTADKLEGPWSEPIQITTPITYWHQEIKFCGSHFIGIFNTNSGTNQVGTVGDLYLGISADGINWQFSDSIFTGQFDNPYKASIQPIFTENGKVKFRILWSISGTTTTAGMRWKMFTAETAEIEVI
ncbi:hypothetical protein NYY91_04490 [Acinetobacter baumannii]|nr:hypothetical protein [Acinetobacter baumannii]